MVVITRLLVCFEALKFIVHFVSYILLCVIDERNPIALPSADVNVNVSLISSFMFSCYCYILLLLLLLLRVLSGLRLRPYVRSPCLILLSYFVGNK